MNNPIRVYYNPDLSYEDSLDLRFISIHLNEIFAAFENLPVRLLHFSELTDSEYDSFYECLYIHYRCSRGSLTPALLEIFNAFENLPGCLSELKECDYDYMVDVLYRHYRAYIKQNKLVDNSMV